MRFCFLLVTAIVCLVVFTKVAFIPTYASDHDGPMTNYCHKIQAQLRDCLKSKPNLNERVLLDFNVDTAGRIKSIKINKFSTATHESNLVAKKILSELEKIEPPPAVKSSPLWLSAIVNKKPEDISVYLKDLDMTPYLTEMQHRIKRCWYPPRGEESKVVVVVFKINSDGTISKLQIAKSSGVDSADKAAMMAVQMASPFGALPDGSSDDVDIQFAFDYNVH